MNVSPCGFKVKEFALPKRAWLPTLKNLCRRFYVFVRRINVNRHIPSSYVFLLWFHDSDHWFYVSGVFYLKNNVLARPRFEPATARNTFQHKNTTPQPSVLGYSASWKWINQWPISIIFWIWSISKDVGSMFWLMLNPRHSFLSELTTCSTCTVEGKCGQKMGSTLGPNRGPRARVLLTHLNSFPFLFSLLEVVSIAYRIKA
jgi:hypothetical protein